MRLNSYGEVVRHTWEDLPRHFANLELGAFTVMPNHVHGLIILNDNRRGGSVQAASSVIEESHPGTEPLPGTLKTRPSPADQALSEIVRAFKSYSARCINLLRRQQGFPVWQRNYYDHIIRNQQDLELTWLYIESNPAQWSKDEENLARIS